jgi:hypothetical protein
MAMTTCPVCNQPLVRSTVLVPGRVVLACRQCRKMTVEVEGVRTEWIMGGPGVVDRLKAMAKDALETKAAIETPIDDPRWTEMMT